MARNFMPQSGALAPYVVVNRDAAVAGVFSVDGLRGSVDLTTKYLTIANFNAYKTTTDGSISSINQSITALNTAVSNKASKGANSDITSITGLTTALGIAYGGTGGKTAAEARTNLGLTTAATTSIGTDGARIPLLNGVNTWATNQTFSGTQTVFSNVSPGGIEIGSSGTAGIAYIDLHSSGTGNDYDVRILSDGGTNTVGRGTLSISAALVKLPALELTSPLGVAFGGTGASSIEGAKSNLGISNFSSIGTSSSVYTPSQNHRLVVNDAGVWGVVKADNTWIALPVAQGGTGATNASNARINLGLGSSATRDAYSSTGQMLSRGDFGLGGPGNNSAGWDIAVDGRLLSSSYDGPSTTAVFMGINCAHSSDSSYCFQLGGRGNQGMWWRARENATFLPWLRVYDTGNTTRASDGTLKAASPVVKLFADGSFENNNESEGCTVTRLATGQYLIEGCQGLNSDAAWGGIDGGFDIPTDRNKQPLIWLDYEVNADGSVLVKTYHRTHPDAPSFARNEIEGISDGSPIDIPSDQFVSVRVEMPIDSIWNQKQKDNEQDYQDVTE